MFTEACDCVLCRFPPILIYKRSQLNDIYSELDVQAHGKKRMLVLLRGVQLTSSASPASCLHSGSLIRPITTSPAPPPSPFPWQGLDGRFKSYMQRSKCNGAGRGMQAGGCKRGDAGGGMQAGGCRQTDLVRRAATAPWGWR